METIERREYSFSYSPETPEDIRVVVGIDFGTTFSGYACASVRTCEVITNTNWPGVNNGSFKTNTVLLYDENLKVSEWGARALVGDTRERKNRGNKSPKPVELFKLHLGNISDNKKPKLPQGLSPEKAITDYLRMMEFTEKTKVVMRQCIYDANLINNIGTQNLQFSTEPEAAAVHCIKVLKDHKINIGDTYLVVDCGGGTVDLTVRKLLENNRLKEPTERSGGFCGSTNVDRNFIEYLENIVGEHAISSLREKHYGQFQYVIQQFCERVKHQFTNDSSDFRTFEFNIAKYCPALKQYIKNPAKDKLEQDDWIIDIYYKNVKLFFDPVVAQILDLINEQLKKIDKCSIIFLVGGFGESKYLQAIIKERFNTYKVAVSPNPVAAIVRGAVEYGLDMDTIKTRVLKWTYGVGAYEKFQEGTDEQSRKNKDGYVLKFILLAKRGIEVDVNQKFSKKLTPKRPDQNKAFVEFFYTPKYTPKYCDESEIHKLGNVEIDLPDTGLNRPILVTLCFGKMEMVVTVKNETDRRTYRSRFNLEI
ncbi:14805_t:CDS:2 [Dentiscutata erythropus]|uniref:14805_t:CDS:1 n=1 Tax=Dentiscutata erythropus TaxID=1348616 RepID=A0A9N8VDV9_9GLOM|nr:14805_t:CDS:2 [Dentiscutata erythropus]